MSRKALIVWGGWDGHQPKEVAEIFARILKEEKFEVEVSDSLDAFNDVEKLKGLSLIVPHWTMGTISNDQCRNVCAAVESGVGIAGCHGGMCDAFRNNTNWQFLTGGQFVEHPGGQVKHTVRITDHNHPATKGVPDFELVSEMYYMHVDPAVKVLGTLRFPVADGPHTANGPVDMPAVFTKLWGKGRVFYGSPGHDAAIAAMPAVVQLMRQGFLWAAKA
jgi:uncharacterized protein